MIHKGRKGSCSTAERGITVLSQCAQRIREKNPFPLSWTSKGEPYGEHKNNFISWIGVCARSFVGCDHDKWENASDTEKKEVLNQIMGDFKVEDKFQKVWCMQRAGEYCRNWKYTLHSEYMYAPCEEHPRPKLSKKVDPSKQSKQKWVPCDCPKEIIIKAPDAKYPQITQEQWEQFIAQHSAESFLAISRKAKASIAHNKSVFYGGRGGYAKIEKEIIAEFQKEGITIKEGEVERYLLWMRGHTPSAGKEMTDYDKAVISQIEKVKKEIELGDFTPKGRDDILSRAVHKPDHPGRVLGKPSTYRFCDVWGKKASPGETWEKGYRNLKGIMKEFVHLMVDVSRGKKLSKKDLEYLGVVVGEQFEKPMPPPVVEKPMPTPASKFTLSASDSSLGEDWMHCVMHGPDTSPFPSDIVAIGSVFIGQATTSHCVALSEKCVRVHVKDVKVPDLEIPFPNTEQKVLLDIKGRFTSWPLDKVFIFQKDFSASREKITTNLGPKAFDSLKGSKRPIDHHSTPSPFPKLPKTNQMPSKVRSFGMKMLLKDAERRKSLGVHTVDVNFEFHLFHQNVDIKLSTDMLVMWAKEEMIEAAHVEIWMRCLAQKCEDLGIHDLYRFVCPSLISNLLPQSTVEGQADYVLSCVSCTECLVNKEQVLFMPFHMGEHWVLAILKPSKGVVYYLDPSRGEVIGFLKSIVDLVLGNRVHLGFVSISYANICMISSKGNLQKSPHRTLQVL